MKICVQNPSKWQMLTVISELINLMKSKGTEYKLKDFWSDMESEYSNILYYIKIQQLSHGHVLKHVWLEVRN